MQTTIYQFIIVLSLLLVGCTSPDAAEETEKPKNVLFIVVDDLNPTLGTYGHPVVKTPNIDRLAQMGIQFNNAYCNYALCGPSRSSFLTGIRPENLGILDNRTPLQSVLGDRVTLPHLFKKNGYETIGIGKIFHNLTPEHGDPKAWDAYHRFEPTELGKQGESRNLTDGELKWCWWQATEGTDDDRPDGMHAKQAVEILKRERDKPLFLAVGFHKPHDPFVAPKKYFDLYPLENCMPPEIPEGWEPASPYSFSQWREIFDRFSEQDKREFTRSYYACTSFMDAQVGRLLDALEETDQLENTLIVFFGDHGYHLGEHNWWNKGTLYQMATKAPFIMAGYGVNKAGAKSESNFEFIDIYPTLSEVMQLEQVPDYLEGKSFVTLLNNPERPFREEVYAVNNRGEMVRNSEWRYISWRDGEELYDQKNDPIEYQNLANNPDFDEVKAVMKLLLSQGPK